MSSAVNLNLLIKEIKDPYVQENFLKLKQFIDCLDLTNVTPTVPGGSGPTLTPSPWEVFARTIPLSSSAFIETIPLNTFCSLEYIMSFKDQFTNEKKALRMRVVNNNGVIQETVYGRTGAAIDLEVNTSIVATDYKLEIVNNSTNGLDINYARLTF